MAGILFMIWAFGWLCGVWCGAAMATWDASDVRSRNKMRRWAFTCLWCGALAILTWSRHLRILPAAMACVLIVGSCFAQVPHFAGNSFTFNSSQIPAAPASLNWRLATAGGQFVEFNLPSVPASLSQTAYLVTPSNAASFGIDFAAWNAAAKNPAYTRSILNFGGFTKEQPFQNPWNPWQLDRIHVFVDSYFPGRFTITDVQVGAIDFLDVPEPCTIGLAVLCLFIAGSTARR